MLFKRIGDRFRQAVAATAGLAVTELAHGVAACQQPERLRAICDQLGPAEIQGFFARWIAQIPRPHRHRPCGRLLVGAVDAPGRGQPHDRL